jgi:regulator of sigma E protease
MDPIGLLGGALTSIMWFVVPFIVVLSVVVFIHELGHFWAARFFRVRVEAFSIGFGHELLAWVDRQGTRWRIAALPLGGYVRFWGDQDATTSRRDADTLDGLTPEQKAVSFHHKPLYQKAVIAAAGPLANFVLAIVIFAGLAMIYGERILPPVVGAVESGSPADLAGLKRGDRIASVNGNPIRSYSEFAKAESLSGGLSMRLVINRQGEAVTADVTPIAVERDDGQGGKIALPSIGIQHFDPPFVSSVEKGSPAEAAGIRKDDLILSANGRDVGNFGAVRDMVLASGGKPVTLVIDRSGQTLTISVTPRLTESQGRKAIYLVGITSRLADSDPRYPVETIYHGPVSALGKAVGETGFIVTKIGEFFGQLLTGYGDYRQLSGPIGIAKVSSDVAQVSLASLVQLIAVLSVSIGLLNLLPIPILDGGHLLYYAIEGIRGRPLGERAQELGFKIGLVFVLGLMIVATFNDIVKVPGWLF